MSRKAFQQLMTDFRRVGSLVVFASSNRLLLQTTKAEVGNAYAYSQYILKSIKAKPLFHFVDLEIKEYWDYLVWYDPYNYGGKACQEVVEQEKQKLDTVMHWQLAAFLPTAFQPIFHDWVVEFIELMHTLKQPQNGVDSTPRATQLPVHLLGTQNDDKPERNIILGKAFEKPLKRQIAGLLKRQKDEMLHPELANDYSFPVLPGSHLKMSNPVLQLVKSLMQVLSLDKNITLEARLLRKELLQLFEIREFSDEARFVNPSESLPLYQVICDNCTLARDIDLCRDEDLMPTSDAATRPWSCTFCSSEFNRLELEERLVGEVEAIVVEWSTQDIKCVKCKTARLNDFAEHCPCSGSWDVGGKSDREGVKARLKVYQRVARGHGLKVLGSVVEGIMEDI